MFDNKPFLVLKCKQIWPTFASHEEGIELRDTIWIDKHGNARLIMWYDTNVDFNFKYSLAHMQTFVTLWR